MRSTTFLSTAVLFLGLSTAAAAQPSDYRRPDPDRYDRYDRYDRRGGQVENVAREIEQTAAAMHREYDRNNRRPDRDEARVKSNLRELYQQAYQFRAEVDDRRPDRRDSRRDLNDLLRAFDETARSLRYIEPRPYVDHGMDRIWSLLRELRRDGYGRAYRGGYGDRGRYDRDGRDGRYGRDSYRDGGRYERRYDWDRDDDRRN